MGLCTIFQILLKSTFYLRKSPILLFVSVLKEPTFFNKVIPFSRNVNHHGIKRAKRKLLKNYGPIIMELLSMIVHVPLEAK